MKQGTVFKNNYNSYVVFVGTAKKGNRQKMVTKSYGDWILKKTPLNLQNMNAFTALERILDICGLSPDDKLIIRTNINRLAKPRGGID